MSIVVFDKVLDLGLKADDFVYLGSVNISFFKTDYLYIHNTNYIISVLYLYEPTFFKWKYIETRVEKYDPNVIFNYMYYDLKAFIKKYTVKSSDYHTIKKFFDYKDKRYYTYEELHQLFASVLRKNKIDKMLRI